MKPFDSNVATVSATGCELDEIYALPWALRLRTIHLAALAVAAISMAAAIEWPRTWQLVVVADLAAASVLFALAAGREWSLRRWRYCAWAAVSAPPSSHNIRRRRPVQVGSSHSRSRVRWTYLVAALIAFLAVSTSRAQPPFGGPPGGLPWGTRNDAAALVAIDAVLRELGVSDEQMSRLEELLTVQRDERHAQFERFAFPPEALEDLPADDGEKKLEELAQQQAVAHRESTKTLYEKLTGILNPAQMERLDQIRVQVSGPEAIDDEQTAGKLQLSPHQRQEMSQILEDARRQSREAFSAATEGDFRARFERMRKIEGDRDDKLLSALTSQQREQFELLKGKPFDLDQLGPRGFRPGGPPDFGPGSGGPMREKRELLATFDKDHDGWLNRNERRAARESLKADREPQPRGGHGARGGTPGAFGPPAFGSREEQEPVKPGIHVEPKDVTPQPDRPLYDPTASMRIPENDECLTGCTPLLPNPSPCLGKPFSRGWHWRWC